MSDPLAAVEEALVVRPGDVLIIRVAPGISRERLDEFATGVKKGLKERFPDPPQLLVIAAEQIAVLRP